METREVKFLLKLLGCENYRSSLSVAAFKFTGRDKICRDLEQRGLIDYSREIASAKILPAGRSLLKVNAENLPISEAELKLLAKIAKSSTKVSTTSIKDVKAADKEAILIGLSDRGFIQVDLKMRRTKPEVWLTERGLEFLRDDFIPKKATNPAISLEMLNNYLLFLRKSLRGARGSIIPPEVTEIDILKPQPTDEEILQLIRDLDRELNTDNYLPFFHLRAKLQPPMSREEVDQALYRLQRSDRIELRTLVHSQEYTPEQVNAGISQRSGTPLFFIILTDN